jgi:hypothetical protein
VAQHLELGLALAEVPALEHPVQDVVNDLLGDGQRAQPGLPHLQGLARVVGPQQQRVAVQVAALEVLLAGGVGVVQLLVDVVQVDALRQLPLLEQQLLDQVLPLEHAVAAQLHAQAHVALEDQGVPVQAHPLQLLVQHLLARLTHRHVHAGLPATLLGAAGQAAAHAQLVLQDGLRQGHAGLLAGQHLLDLQHLLLGVDLLQLALPLLPALRPPAHLAQHLRVATPAAAVRVLQRHVVVLLQLQQDGRVFLVLAVGAVDPDLLRALPVPDLLGEQHVQRLLQVHAQHPGRELLVVRVQHVAGDPLVLGERGPIYLPQDLPSPEVHVFGDELAQLLPLDVRALLHEVALAALGVCDAVHVGRVAAVVLLQQLVHLPLVVGLQEVPWRAPYPHDVFLGEGALPPFTVGGGLRDCAPPRAAPLQQSAFGAAAAQGLAQLAHHLLADTALPGWALCPTIPLTLCLSFHLGL